MAKKKANSNRGRAFTLAGPWPRVFGYVIDDLASLVVVAVGLGWMMQLGYLDDPVEYLLTLSDPMRVALFYGVGVPLEAVQVWLLVTRGQTLGKILCGTRVVRPNGDPADFFRAVVLRRWLLSFLYGIPFFGRFVYFADRVTLWTASRRTLHDFLADTIVVEA